MSVSTTQMGDQGEEEKVPMKPLLSLQSLFEPPSEPPAEVGDQPRRHSEQPQPAPVDIGSRLTVSTGPQQHSIRAPSPLVPVDSMLITQRCTSAPVHPDAKKSAGSLSLFEGDGNTVTSYLTSRSWDPRLALHSIGYHYTNNDDVKSSKFMPLSRPVPMKHCCIYSCLL